MLIFSDNFRQFRVVLTFQFCCNASRKNPPKTTPPIVRVKISSRVGHRRKSYERTQRQGGGRSGKLGGISQNFCIFLHLFHFLYRPVLLLIDEFFRFCFLYGVELLEIYTKCFFYLKKYFFFEVEKSRQS